MHLAGNSEKWWSVSLWHGHPIKMQKFVIAFSSHSRNRGLKPTHTYLCYVNNTTTVKLSHIRKIGRNGGIDLELIAIISGIMQLYDTYTSSVDVSCENYWKWRHLVWHQSRWRIAPLSTNFGVIFGNSHSFALRIRLTQESFAWNDCIGIHCTLSTPIAPRISAITVKVTLWYYSKQRVCLTT